MNREEFRAKANLELISESKLLFLVEKPGESELGKFSGPWFSTLTPVQVGDWEQWSLRPGHC